MSSDNVIIRSKQMYISDLPLPDNFWVCHSLYLQDGDFVGFAFYNICACLHEKDLLGT